VPGVVDGEGEDSSITYAEIHSELEEVRRILVELTRTVERLSSTIASVNLRQRGSTPTPSAATVGPPSQTAPLPTQSPAPSAPVATATTPSSPTVAPNPVDAILGETFGRPI
jgi:hypothetical protein